MNKVLFFDIDTQKDFMDTDGALAIPNANTIRPNLRELITCATRTNSYIVASIDTHSENDPEFDLFVPHCIKNTPGAEKIPETYIPNSQFIPNRKLKTILINSNTILIQKNQFDVFTNPNTEKVLELINPDEVIVFGVASDICVKAAVCGLIQKGYKIKLVIDAIKGTSDVESEKFINYAKDSGVELITTEEVLKGSLCLLP